MPFASPVASTIISKRKLVTLPPVSKKGILGVDELLDVFLELEQLDDKHIRSAEVLGRKKLQTLASTGTTHTEVIDIITIEDDDDKPMSNNQPVEELEHQLSSLPPPSSPIDLHKPSTCSRGYHSNEPKLF